jgi:hypothetical protein
MISEGSAHPIPILILVIGFALILLLWKRKRRKISDPIRRPDVISRREDEVFRPDVVICTEDEVVAVGLRNEFDEEEATNPTRPVSLVFCAYFTDNPKRADELGDLYTGPIEYSEELLTKCLIVPKVLHIPKTQADAKESVALDMEFACFHFGLSEPAPEGWDG